MKIKEFRQVETKEVETTPSAEYLRKAAHMEAVIDAQPDCVKVIAADYTLINMNYAGLDMIGALTIDQVRGVDICNLIETEYHEIFKQAVDAGYEGKSTEVEYTITGLNGIKRYMCQRCAPIFSAENPAEVIELVAVTRDITSKHENLIALEKAKSIAEDASKVKSNFLANMSHEFRTPLNAILGFSEMIRSESFGEIGNKKYAEYVDDIYKSGTHLLDLINNVLDISEIEADKRVLLKEEVDLEEIALHSLNTVKILAESKLIMVSVNIAANIPKIFADKRSMKQIFINLLSNAVKFSLESGRVSINIHSDDGNVCVTIRDEGIGIAEENLENITKPFFRGETDAEISAPGTGLGLSIVKSLLDAHNAILLIESTEHIGTTVTFKFPVHK